MSSLFWWWAQGQSTFEWYCDIIRSLVEVINLSMSKQSLPPPPPSWNISLLIQRFGMPVQPLHGEGCGSCGMGVILAAKDFLNVGQATIPHLTGFSRTRQTTVKGYYINLLNGSNSHCWKSNLYINLMVFSWCTHYREVMRALMSVVIQITIFHSPTNLGKFLRLSSPSGLTGGAPEPRGDESLFVFCCSVIIQISIFQLTFIFIKSSINLGQFVRLSSPSEFTGGAPKPWGDESLFVFCCLVTIQISIFQLTFIFIKM